MFGLLNWWWTGNWSVWTLQPQVRPSLLALSLSLSLSPFCLAYYYWSSPTPHTAHKKRSLKSVIDIQHWLCQFLSKRRRMMLLSAKQNKAYPTVAMAYYYM
jgi:hypothetical protein